MATLALGVAGQAIGGAIGGTFLGIGAAALGQAAGTAIGSMIDARLFGPGDQTVEGQRLEDVEFTSSTEGASIPRLWGRMRLGGNVIWATDFREEVSETSEGGKGLGGPTVTTREFTYFASFALAVCEGPIGGVGRMWANGEEIDQTRYTIRLYPGTEDQQPDSHIEQKEGGPVPAYRGVAYIVFENADLTEFGNRIPQLAVEVIRPLESNNSAADMMRAVTIIPSAGEFVYATEVVEPRDSDDPPPFSSWVRADGGAPDNRASPNDRADFLLSMDELEAAAPGLESTSLVVAWFGTDLRVGECALEPRVEFTDKLMSRQWSVSGIGREQAPEVSRTDGNPSFGGTPADFSVVQSIQELKSRGWRVTFYPFILMDIPEGNELPNPYSDNASQIGQPVFPWRGRITVSPAAGFDGSPDKTSGAADQVADFFGGVQASDFEVNGETVTYTGDAQDRGFRRMILHYAHLCVAAGGVDTFLIGTEMIGLTQIRSDASTYPAVERLVQLAQDVRGILGAGTKISYAADWSEYFGHQPTDGSGDVFFHLDPLWAHDEIDFVAIDNYMPLSDWRDGRDHIDAQSWNSVYDLDYLRSNILGGEGYDWFYASGVDREAQTRMPITDGAEGKPWVFRYKDLPNWWANQHFNRPGGSEASTPTAWVPESKPIWFTEAGSPAVDKGTNQPNVFFDPKSSESFLPHFSRGVRDDLIQRRYIEALYSFWRDDANNPESSEYSGRMIEVSETAIWTWDARPFPAFPGRSDKWADGDNYLLGHWLNGRLSGVGIPEAVAEICVNGGVGQERIDTTAISGELSGYAIESIESPRQSLERLANYAGFDGLESEGVIRFVPRHRAPIFTLERDDLVRGRDSEEIRLSRAPDTGLPLAIKRRFLDAGSDFEGLTVEARRIDVDTARISSTSVPIATHQAAAERAVRRDLGETWLARETAEFSLPPSRLALDPSDAIRVNLGDREIEIALSEVTDGESRAVRARASDLGLTAIAVGDGRAARARAPRISSRPQALLMNLPRLSGDVEEFKPYAAAFASPWPGEVVFYRSPGEDGFVERVRVSAPAGIGRLVNPLGAGPTGRWDYANELWLRIAGRTLSSAPNATVFDGTNVLAVQTNTNDWEVLQFAKADLVEPGLYRLTQLLRGQLGTDGQIGVPAPEGTLAVVLDSALRAVGIDESNIGLEANWRVAAAGDAPNDDNAIAFEFTPLALGRRPFSPAGLRRVDNADGSLYLAWTRRSRDRGADRWDEEPRLGEETERYDIEILDSGTVVREVTGLTSPDYAYAAGDVTDDFGAVPAALGLRVWQVGEFGRGAPTEATLPITRRTT